MLSEMNPYTYNRNPIIINRTQRTPTARIEPVERIVKKVKKRVTPIPITMATPVSISLFLEAIIE
jgi:hypothetical protein